MSRRPIAHGGQRRVVVSAGFQELLSSDVRLLQEASKLGSVHGRLWSDELIASLSGRPPRFSESERRFFVENTRYVDSVSLVRSREMATRPLRGIRPDVIVVHGDGVERPERLASERADIRYVELGPDQLAGFPVSYGTNAVSSAARRVVVSGCFDWLHTGHVEFFREAASLGDLYVVVGSDRNVRLLKGDGHPLHREDERLYMVQAMRPVHRALISTGRGWMDAEPEIALIRPHVYVVNEDGDEPEKRDFCRAHNLEYVVLRRRPHRGLPCRTSTELRGF